MLFELFEKLKTMEPGPERDELTRLTANQMKRNLAQWSHSSTNEERVASDLAKYTDGKIQLDIDTFKFEKTHNKENDHSLEVALVGVINPCNLHADRE